MKVIVIIIAIATLAFANEERREDNVDQTDRLIAAETAGKQPSQRGGEGFKGKITRQLVTGEVNMTGKNSGNFYNQAYNIPQQNGNNGKGGSIGEFTVENNY